MTSTLADAPGARSGRRCRRSQSGQATSAASGRGWLYTPLFYPPAERRACHFAPNGLAYKGKNPTWPARSQPDRVQSARGAAVMAATTTIGPGAFRRRLRAWTPWLLLAPGMLWLLAFFIWPTIQMLLMSFSSGNADSGFHLTGSIAASSHSRKCNGSWRGCTSSRNSATPRSHR